MKLLIVSDMQNDFIDGALESHKTALTAMKLCQINVKGK